MVPLAVPVRVRDDVDVVWRGHARKLQRGAPARAAALSTAAGGPMRAPVRLTARSTRGAAARRSAARGAQDARRGGLA
jgi:hypothetical protein